MPGIIWNTNFSHRPRPRRESSTDFTSGMSLYKKRLYYPVPLTQNENSRNYEIKRAPTKIYNYFQYKQVERNGSMDTIFMNESISQGYKYIQYISHR